MPASCRLSSKPNKAEKWLVSASSDGYIKLWSLNVNKVMMNNLARLIMEE